MKKKIKTELEPLAGNECEPQNYLSLFEAFGGENTSMPSYMIPQKQKRLRKIKPSQDENEISLLKIFEGDCE